MTKKINCWDYKKCDRGPNGIKRDYLGACPAAKDIETHRLNNGTNGGRMCWAVAGTLCGDRPQGIYAQKIENCIHCDFYKLVREQEGESFEFMTPKQKLARKENAESIEQE
jgi:hypothetical protein